MLTVLKGDIGTVIELTIQDENGAAVDVSTAAVKQILMRAPSGSVLTKTASFTTTGADGKIRYTTISGDLSEDGIWTVDGYIEIGTTPKFHTTAFQFQVDDYIH